MARSNPKIALKLVMTSSLFLGLGTGTTLLSLLIERLASEPIWVCGASPRFCAGASTVSAASAAVPAHLVRKELDVDRLLEIAGETCGPEPDRVVPERYRRQRDDGNRRCPRLLGEHLGGVRTVHVREPEIHEDHVWEMFVGERHPLLA